MRKGSLLLMREVDLFFKSQKVNLIQVSIVGCYIKKGSIIIEAFLRIVLLSMTEIIYLLGSLIAVGFILGYLEKWSNTFLFRGFGYKGIMFTAWIGTPIHELGHAIMCILFGHKVRKIKLLQWKSEDGILGFVAHEYNPRSLYQRVGNFFIGTAPIITGTISLVIAMYFLLPDTFLLYKGYLSAQTSTNINFLDVIQIIDRSILALFKNLFTIKNFIDPFFYLFLYLSLSISSRMALSRADMKGAFDGFIVLFGLIIFINMIAGLINVNSMLTIVVILKYNAYVLAFLSVALFFSIMNFMISYGLFKIKQVYR